MVEALITLADGEAAIATAYTVGSLQLICAAAFPPGKPIAFEAMINGECLKLQARSAGSKRREDGRYDVVVRLVSLRRTAREQLENFFSTKS